VLTRVLPVHSYESFARIIFKIMLKAFATFALPIVICTAVIVEPAFPQTPTEAPGPLGKMIDLFAVDEASASFFRPSGSWCDQRHDRVGELRDDYAKATRGRFQIVAELMAT
jgi:hypothetical protein